MRVYFLGTMPLAILATNNTFFHETTKLKHISNRDYRKILNQSMQDGVLAFESETVAKYALISKRILNNVNVASPVIFTVDLDERILGTAMEMQPTELIQYLPNLPGLAYPSIDQNNEINMSHHEKINDYLTKMNLNPLSENVVKYYNIKGLALTLKNIDKITYMGPFNHGFIDKSPYKSSLLSEDSLAYGLVFIAIAFMASSVILGYIGLILTILGGFDLLYTPRNTNTATPFMMEPQI